MNTGNWAAGGSSTDVDLVRTKALMDANSALTRDPSNDGGPGHLWSKFSEE